MTMRSSEELIQHIAQGNRDSLGELYDRYASVVRAVTLAILCETASADDVVQAVFVEAWRDARRYDALRDRPAAWLTTLARRRALGRLLRQPRMAVRARHDPSEPLRAP
jgi:RNA polymerase sigma-70 factor (ECF subfamily)